VNGFLSHTYIMGLRLRVGDELISESHARAWAAGVPLLGIVGNDLHERTLGSLSDTPFLVVQESVGRPAMRPVFDEPEEGLRAIRAFAERCVRERASARPIEQPTDVTFGASMPNGDDVVAQMAESGWTRVGDVEFTVELRAWADAREPLATAMNAALAPFMPYWLGAFPNAEAARGADQDRVSRLGDIFDRWAEEPQPEWYTDACDPLPAGTDG
jgi:hypothetical protein